MDWYAVQCARKSRNCTAICSTAEKFFGKSCRPMKSSSYEAAKLQYGLILNSKTAEMENLQKLKISSLNPKIGF